MQFVSPTRPMGAPTAAQRRARRLLRTFGPDLALDLVINALAAGCRDGRDRAAVESTGYAVIWHALQQTGGRR